LTDFLVALRKEESDIVTKRHKQSDENSSDMAILVLAAILMTGIMFIFLITR